MEEITVIALMGDSVGKPVIIVSDESDSKIGDIDGTAVVLLTDASTDENEGCLVGINVGGSVGSWVRSSLGISVGKLVVNVSGSSVVVISDPSPSVAIGDSVGRLVTCTELGMFVLYDGINVGSAVLEVGIVVPVSVGVSVGEPVT